MRYPATKKPVPTRCRLTRSYTTTIGSTDGNIIAAIITTQTTMKNPSVPGSVPGPASMPSIRPAVTVQATTASASSKHASTASARAIRPRGARATNSARPGERRRERRLARVVERQPERGDLAPLRARDRQGRTGRMEHALEARGLTALDAERHDVLNRDVDPLAHTDRVSQAVVCVLDR